MGTRYDFELTANLKEDVPQDVVQMLSFLLQPGQETPTVVPDHPFFSGEWRGEPFVNWFAEIPPHAGDSVCSFRRVFQYTQCGVDHYQHTVHLRFAAPLETVAEVGLPFAMWVAKWSAHSECVGYFKGEEEGPKRGERSTRRTQWPN